MQVGSQSYELKMGFRDPQQGQGWHVSESAWYSYIEGGLLLDV